MEAFGLLIYIYTNGKSSKRSKEMRRWLNHAGNGCIAVVVLLVIAIIITCIYVVGSVVHFIWHVNSKP